MKAHLALVLTLAACGPNAAELKAAHYARYRAEPAALLDGVAAAVTAQRYHVDQVAPDRGELTTIDKIFSAEGQTESVGARDAVDVHNNSIALAFLVRLMPAAGGAITIEIVPSIRRVHSDRPNLDTLSLDDPTLPGWVPVKIDELAIAIHAQLAAYEIK